MLGLTEKSECNLTMADKTFAGCPILGEDDVLTILNELVDVAPRWELLATCLKLSPSDVENIKSQYSGNVNLALSKVISRWLATSPDDRTWSDVVEVLRQPILSEERSAKQIEQRYLHSHKPTHCKFNVEIKQVKIN